MSRVLTARIVVVLSMAFWVWGLVGCHSEPEAKIEGTIEKADPGKETAKPAKPPVPDPNQ